MLLCRLRYELYRKGDIAMKKKILLMLLMSVVVLTMAVCGASGETFDKSKIGTVIIGYDGTYPPFNFMDDNAEPTGFEIE